MLAAPIVAFCAQEPFKITDNVDIVLLDVSVRSHSGQYVVDLPQNSFSVFVDGKSQHISQFARIDEPVTIGLIVDSSGSMRPKRAEVVTAGMAFARESNPKDEFFVVNFNDYVRAGLPAGIAYTDNLQQLHSALFMGQPAGRTALYDAIAYGLHQLEASHYETRTLIVVSDGGDNASKLKIDDLIRLIYESRATIYCIGLYDEEDRDLKPRILKKISEISGGEYFRPRKLDDIKEVLDKISKDIRTRYSIGFTPQVEPSGNPLHMIRVTAVKDGKKYTVRTRTSFLEQDGG